MNNTTTIRKSHLELAPETNSSLHDMQEWLNVYKEAREKNFQKGVAYLRKEFEKANAYWKDFFNQDSVFQIRSVSCFSNWRVSSKSEGFVEVAWIDASITFITGNNQTTTATIDNNVDRFGLGMNSFRTSLGWQTRFQDMVWIERFWNNLANLLPEINVFLHESRKFHEQCQEAAEKFNQELKLMDEEIEAFRQRIYELETAAFFGGAKLSFNKVYSTGLRKFWIKSRQFEYVRSVRVIGYSESGKTITVRIVYSPKVYREYHGYHVKDSKKLITKTISGLRKCSLLRNFALPPR